MASQKVLHGVKFENIARLFPGWDETLEREEKEQEDEDLLEYAAVKKLESEVCFDYHIDSENDEIYQQNEIDCYLVKRGEHYKILQRSKAFSMGTHTRLGVESPLFQLDDKLMNKIAVLAFSPAPAALRKKKTYSLKKY